MFFLKLTFKVLKFVDTKIGRRTLDYKQIKRKERGSMKRYLNEDIKDCVILYVEGISKERFEKIKTGRDLKKNNEVKIARTEEEDKNE